jgi:uncharacterized membrane protein
MNKVSSWVISYLIILAYYLAFDLTMIKLYNGVAFGKMIKKIQGSEMTLRIIPSILAFLLLAFGLKYFIIDKVSEENIVWDSFRYGFTFGIVVYGVYDLTNLGIIKDYTYQVGIIDMLWGGFVNFIVVLLAKLTMLRINP